MKIENVKWYQLVYIILGIIIIVPFLYTMPALFPNYSFSKTGEIGDTIGGLTAPFINGIAAILVFLAFKEQIKANKIQSASVERIHNLERIKVVMETIGWLRRDEYQIGKQAKDVSQLLSPPSNVPAEPFNKATYVLYEIKSTLDYIENNIQGEKDELKTKLGVLYRVIYQPDCTAIAKLCDKFINAGGNDPYFVLSYIGVFKEVERRLGLK